MSSAGSRPKSGIPTPLWFFGAIFCAGCCWLGLQVAGPIQQAARLHNENDALERTLRRTEIRNVEARKQAAAMATDQGAILAARSKGYTFENERPLRIQSHDRP
jgi:hypothetical protein